MFAGSSDPKGATLISHYLVIAAFWRDSLESMSFLPASALEESEKEKWEGSFPPPLVLKWRFVQISLKVKQSRG